jgi:hypothetical protein
MEVQFHLRITALYVILFRAPIGRTRQKFLPAYLEFLLNTPSESIGSVDSSDVREYGLLVSFHFKLPSLNDLIKNTFNL